MVDVLEKIKIALKAKKTGLSLFSIHLVSKIRQDVSFSIHKRIIAGETFVRMIYTLIEQTTQERYHF
jgi:hypothetical protein